MSCTKRPAEDTGPESKIRRKLDLTDDNRYTAADLFTALLKYRSSKTTVDQSHSTEYNSLKMNNGRNRATLNLVSSNNRPFNRDSGTGKSQIRSLSRMSVTSAEDANPALRDMLETADIVSTSRDMLDDAIMPLSKVDISPTTIASLFAEEAEKSLTVAEFKDLLQFLNNRTSYDAQQFHQLVIEKLDAFYIAEVQESSEPRNRLARPSGPENADLGLIMHCQSKEGEIGPFWDIESPSIQSLAQKGLSVEFMFGFDWHWRAETSARGRGVCSTNHWTKAQRNIHDTLSSDLLEILPLPLLIVAGGCAKMSYRTTLSTKARRIEIVLASNFSIELDLDFTPNGLKRITTYIPHPATSFFQLEIFKQFSIRRDASLNFFLWLLGKDGIRTFIKRNPKHQRGVSRSAPLEDLYAYRAIERKFQRSLAEHEYDIDFLIWACRYLKEDPAAILARGGSLAERIVELIKQKLRTPENKRKNHQNNARRWGKMHRNFWDGHCVTLDKQGILTLLVSIDWPGIKLRLGLLIAQKVKGSTESLTIHFSKQGLEFQHGQRTVYQKSQEELLSLKQYGRQWVEQLERELAHKESTILLAPPTNRLRSGPLDVGSGSASLTTTSLETMDTDALLFPSLGPPSNAKTTPKEMTPRLDCFQCGKSYKNYSSLLRHTVGTHDFKPTKCPHDCGKTLDSYPKLNWHIRQHHKPQFSTRCRFLGCESKTMFTLWSRYSTHLRKDHKLIAAEAYQYDPRNSKKRSRRSG